ncbi:CAAX amino terminal protease self- immunity [Corynebacterium pelargi]|uniref:CAAX amino terminal protease self-immunity n=2 Tax=Corynebacterium pelargi TaxID=1471400 RepID=A0A410W6W7_9CORY|nr:CAAX amino terminal protease self- immunity [Corynebacterium pelargi]
MESAVFGQRVLAVRAQGTWRQVGLPVIIALVVLAVLPAGFSAASALILGDGFGELFGPSSAIGMILAVVVGGLLMIKASNLSWEALGFSRTGWLKHCLLGILCGLVLLSIAALLIAMSGAVAISWNFESGMLGPIAIAFVFFLAQGTWEELVYRGYLMPHFTRRWGVVPSIIITSLAFAAFHALNPGLTLLPIANLIIFGFVFALFYFRTGNMWLVGFAHGAWNFSQGFFFGSEVSGNQVHASVLKTVPEPGHDLLSGGAFGFEGSVVTSLLGCALIIFLTIGWPKLQPNAQKRIT